MDWSEPINYLALILFVHTVNNTLESNDDDVPTDLRRVISDAEFECHPTFKDLGLLRFPSQKFTSFDLCSLC